MRAFGIEHLGLHDGGTYTTFVQLDRPFVSYNLTVSPVDAIEPYVWRYPVVGRMPYQGFFSKDAALAARDGFRQAGYDTYLRGVRAYSTLGYFADPILSSMLAYPDGALIETVLHEMLHETVWIRGPASASTKASPTSWGGRGPRRIWQGTAARIRPRTGTTWTAGPTRNSCAATCGN